MNHAALIARLCEASEGSAELSRECWEALTGEAHVTNFAGNVGRVCHNDDERWEELVPCLTTDLSAAWEEAKVRDLWVAVFGEKSAWTADVYGGGDGGYSYTARTPALAPFTDSAEVRDE